MLRLRSLAENQCRFAMANGDFGDDVKSSTRYVAVVLTQSWCPDWKWMQGWLERQSRQGQPEDLDIEVWELEYNRAPFFDDFRSFKERQFDNYQIPYVRYYVDGEYIGDSNQLSADAFYARFREAPLSA
ncbi:hypothetical protein [Salinispira pacifica]